MHFLIGVMLPKSELPEKPTPEEVYKLLEPRLEPFNENTRGPERTITDCDCGQWANFRVAHDTLRDLKLPTPARDADDAAWEKHEDERIAWLEKWLAEHAAVPQSDCERCKGTGKLLTPDVTTYPEGAKWDWWQLGGRFTGIATGEDPTQNPENTEACTLCEGKGCLNCDKGRRVKWPTSWVRGQEWQDVGVLKERQQTVYGVLTKDGKWLTRDRPSYMPDKPMSQWRKELAEIYDAHLDCVMAFVDCHK